MSKALNLPCPQLSITLISRNFEFQGENFEFIKVAEKTEPQGNAFLTRAQRKTMKRGKKTTVSKESIKKMMDKETKLKFDKELVYVKPFKVEISAIITIK